MENKHMMAFEIIRGLVAILIAIAVAFIFIFICADDPGEALQCLLIKPIISNGDDTRTNNADNIYRPCCMRYVFGSSV